MSKVQVKKKVVKKRQSRNEEDRSLLAYHKWLRNKGWDANYHHVGNELPATTPQMKKFTSILKQKGKKPGFPDITIFEQNENYPVLFIELKTAKGRLSTAQLVFLANANKQGYLAVAAYGLEQAQRITEWYMTDSKEPLPIKHRKQTSDGIPFEYMEAIKYEEK